MNDLEGLLSCSVGVIMRGTMQEESEKKASGIALEFIQKATRNGKLHMLALEFNLKSTSSLFHFIISFSFKNILLFFCFISYYKKKNSKKYYKPLPRSYEEQKGGNKQDDESLGP